MDLTFAEDVVASGTGMITVLFGAAVTYWYLIIPVALGFIAISWFTGGIDWLMRKIRGLGR